MNSKVSLVAHCGNYALFLDLKQLIIFQKFSSDSRRTRKFQLSLLGALSFIEAIDQYNMERKKVLQQKADPEWMLRLLHYIEDSYLVNEVEVNRQPA
ncbi:hypothetical protein LFYK43_02090 [Ligilactobacillus salitolerans]|uniref:Uncharacterized protein n=1 Tax=Ligilactobacillus salitolerans TaxID=1808352 RepID=A0A401IQF5_9LACO|nr:hypothetical protein [Ligilactobacillus salitolerans]GBG93750.1 hypothetical protein LFYK43_02090 [Ligilactobacillus salitolerans]